MSDETKLPPEWQTTIDMLNGKFDDELCDSLIDNWQVIYTLAVKTRISYVPDQHKKAVADAFIKAAQSEYDRDVNVAVTALLKSWDMGEKALEIAEIDEPE
ncbi:MAG: hypothetical protein COU22_02050 [Candidatus Komeilibacteria bacterium CG10_big_fil_rev_8_21_14_0_10_41_13]|uniref:Uncharacterized protein n=1 Tax=Candidatus Komeilibacteria bacterium CG10_big_fil_rev_8_21_14_0_10_41_13 TaxID=1974476 RepID=A0A2M6WCD1_9BACT|nr:MAG: hypothetical protein COU22_02050 [Candidatus Komeilibacteria bacterium CG10_big_fil_rev_8_21_14_0_10_41_13]